MLFNLLIPFHKGETQWGYPVAELLRNAKVNIYDIDECGEKGKGQYTKVYCQSGWIRYLRIKKALKAQYTTTKDGVKILFVKRA